MPKNYSYYEAYYVKSRKSKKNPLRIFVIICAIFAIGITIFSSMVFSDFLNINVFSFNNTSVLDKTTYYAIQIGEYSSREEAVSVSALYKDTTAAGYILTDGDTYRVLASAYENLSDANSVLENIELNVPTASIYEINVECVNFSSKILSENKSQITDAVNLFSLCYSSLYQLSLRVDINNISKEELLIEVDILKQNCQSTVDSFKASYENSVEMEIVYTEIYLERLTECVDELVDILREDCNSASAIKETYFKIIYCYINFAKEL